MKCHQSIKKNGIIFYNSLFLSVLGKYKADNSTADLPPPSGPHKHFFKEMKSQRSVTFDLVLLLRNCS